MNVKDYILLINREKKFLETIRTSLAGAGYSVLTTMSMSNALSLLTGNTVKLIICDSELNDFSGLEFLRFIKNNPTLESIPFVFFVPVHDQGSAGKAFKLGATDFIVYPLDTKILIERIEEILSAKITREQATAIPKESKRESFIPPVSTASSGRKERRDCERVVLDVNVNIEISRDAILWLPGQVKNIGKNGFLIETPLLGRLGMLLYIRVQLPTAKCVIESRVRHITINTHHLAADIGVEIEDSLEWSEVFNFIFDLIEAGENLETEKHSAADIMPDINKMNMSETEAGAETVVRMESSETICAAPDNYDADAADDEKELEIRFYHSLVGKQLGNYKAVSFIGAGAMGGVFKGWDIVLERNVALKIISYKLSSIAAFRDMFVKEARFISRLNHPNIAQIYYIDQTDDVLYFAMELINGGTLKDMIGQRNKRNEAKCLGYLITVCRTLDFVSKKNIIHRDIKPENIMISNNGVLKVVDFGVAVVNNGDNEKSKSADLVGSPYYVSPDCITGLPLDSRSDIYSLGATFYHVFAGVPPFEGDNVTEVLGKHLNEELVPLKMRNSAVLDSLSDIIGKMMAKNPADRYQDYQSIINDLDLLIH